jgi:cytosolic carboxypeptidase protein 2/3
MNTIPNVPYKFNILNLSKPGSQFNNGMQPVVYSLSDPVWKRAGESVLYLKNHFRKSDINGDSALDKEGDVMDTNTYASLMFTMTFKNPADTYFIAYHYPYTYSGLQRFLHRLYRVPTFQMRCKRTSLCQTLGGNECPLLTVTDFDPGNMKFI